MAGQENGSGAAATAPKKPRWMKNVVVDKSRIESMLPLLKEAGDKLREEKLETRDAIIDHGMRVEYLR